MDVEKLFRRKQNRMRIRLALEEWTELPETDTPEWDNLVYLLKGTELAGSVVLEAQHNGVDLFLLVDLSPAASIGSIVEALHRQLGDPFWQPFINTARFSWIGNYHTMSLRPEEDLAAYPLEHPSRRWKREHLLRQVGRTVDLPWHDASTPEAAGIKLLACVGGHADIPGSNRLYLFYEAAEENRDEARAAAHLNFRLRIPGTGPMCESEGWNYVNGFPALVFQTPKNAETEYPSEVEIWWSTDHRKLFTTLPCYEPGTEPEYLRPERHWEQLQRATPISKGMP